MFRHLRLPESCMCCAYIEANSASIYDVFCGLDSSIIPSLEPLTRPLGCPLHQPVMVADTRKGEKG